MATESIEIQLLVDGERAATQALNNVTGQVQKLSTAQKQSADASRAQSSAMVGATQASAKFQSTLSLAGQAVGTFSSSGGKMVQVLGQAAGSMAILGSSFGPVGIAIGAATAAFGLFTASMDENKKSAEEVAKVYSDLNSELDEFVRKLPSINQIIAAQRATRENLDLEARLGAGEGSAEQQTAARMRAQTVTRTAQTAYDNALRYGSSNEEIERRKRDLERAQEAEQRYTDAQQGRRVDMFGRPISGQSLPTVDFNNVGASGGGGGGGRSANSESARTRDIFDRLLRGNAAPRGSVYGQGRSLDDLMSGGSSAGFGDLEGGFNGEQNAIEKQMKMEADARQQVTDAIDEQKRAMDDLAFSAGTTAVDAFEMLASTAVSGGKISGKAFVAMAGGFLKATGQQMLGQGIKNQFEAAALLTNPVTASFGAALAGVASGQIATGAAMMAGGVVANIGAAAIKEPGSGRGGGGGSRGSFGPTATGYSNDRGYQGPATIVVNLENAVLANTYADAGKIINRAVREAQLRYGRE